MPINNADCGVFFDIRPGVGNFVGLCKMKRLLRYSVIILAVEWHFSNVKRKQIEMYFFEKLLMGL